MGSKTFQNSASSFLLFLLRLSDLALEALDFPLEVGFLAVVRCLRVLQGGLVLILLVQHARALGGRGTGGGFGSGLAGAGFVHLRFDGGFDEVGEQLLMDYDKGQSQKS